MVGYLNQRERIEIIEKIEKSIDFRASRRFFKHVRQLKVEQLEGLRIRKIFMPKHLTTFFSVGYDSNSALSDDGQSSNNSSRKEWSQVFDRDGRFRFHHILSLFPPSHNLSPPEKHMYEQTIFWSHFAVSSYNENHGADYELVAPIVSFPFCKPVYDVHAYVNFFAKPKYSDSSPDLFFAELVACGYSANQVVRCCILKPRPFPVAKAFDIVEFWLPPGEEYHLPSVMF